MAKDSASKKNRPANWRPLARYGVLLGGLLIILSTGIYASQQVEQFLIRDPRFFLPGPPDYGMKSPDLEIRGVRFASRGQVMNTFSRDFGRSVYLLPLSERRKSLLRLNWVKDAALLRLWPNHLVVTITERQPAAFLDLRVDNMSRWALIDSDGVILDPPARSDFKLPVVTGIRADEPLGMRGTRVRRMQRMLGELGSMSDKVSEVNVADLDNLKITEQIGSRTLVLMLGEARFGSRLRNFLDHYPEIARKMPNAHAFDLRLDDRITAAGGQNGL